MIDPTAKLSVSRQAIVLGISRGAFYCQPRPVSDADLKLMHRTRKLHMEFRFAGSRMLQGLLVQEGCKVRRLQVAALRKRMGRVGERPWFERTREGGARASRHPRNLQHGAWSRQRFGRPGDVRATFTSTDFIKVLAAREIKISMDGKAAWRDNVLSYA